MRRAQKAAARRLVPVSEVMEESIHTDLWSGRMVLTASAYTNQDNMRSDCRKMLANCCWVSTVCLAETGRAGIAHWL
jgi:hypothetical protein